MNNSQIELLAPGGDVDSIKAAIVAGADAVYCGLDKFNARNRAANISFEDLLGIVRLAHAHDCKIFLTLNIILLESEIPTIVNLLNKLTVADIDGVIVQDLGALYILSTYFESLPIHASTQMTTHNAGQIEFLKRLNTTRVNLSRELNIGEISELTEVAHRNNISIEVFVHGAYCISFSGLCYMSSVNRGDSGNRGRCGQPCRDRYVPTAQGNHFPLNMKDNSAFFHLREIVDAGVDSVKIEGRMKDYHYVYTVTSSWREHLRNFYHHNELGSDDGALHKVFNRGFSSAYLTGDIGKDMFIDDPRNNAAKYLSNPNESSTDEKIKTATKQIQDEKNRKVSLIKEEIDQLSIEKASLSISFSGESGHPLKATVITPNRSFSVYSTVALTPQDKPASLQLLNSKLFLERFKAINDTAFYIAHLETADLQSDLFVPFKEITKMKNDILTTLTGSKQRGRPIQVPPLRKRRTPNKKPSLCVLVSSEEDLSICDNTDAEFYFQIPNGFKNEASRLTSILRENPKVMPWFPSVLIGKDYDAAVVFLEQLRPSRIVTNNTGVAYKAFQMGIPWVAGPYLNIVNSFSMLCLKETFNCVGGFVSNEISQLQLRKICCPDNFELYYSIYHPIVLFTSRQCLFQQVTGCEKNRIDESCISQCEKYSTITNLNNESFFIEKTRGNYPSIYNERNYLNIGITTDVQNLFSSYFIDLRNVKTETRVSGDKLKIVKLFENHIEGNADSVQELKQRIHPTACTQYQKGV